MKTMSLCRRLINKMSLWSVLSSCLVSCAARDPETEAYHHFLGDCSNRISREYNLECYGSGGSRPDKIQVVKFFFNSSEQMNVQQARRLSVAVAEKMIHEMNTDQKLRLYLQDYPATYKNIIALIAFEKIKRDDRNTECLHCVIIGSRDFISYIKEDSNTGRLYDAYEEPLTEAKRILAEEEQCT